MCGIAGYFSATKCDGEDWPTKLQQASQAMTLRGPDAHGTYIQPGIGLAHRRLAIIDPEGGQQPWTDPQTGATITFNGEIYNFQELQKDLAARGHCFATQCDTEVLLHAYVEWGADCVDRLMGMFAFAIYTPQDGTLFLARDRLGVKPLFWAETDNMFCFASSVSALRHLLPGPRDLNVAAVSHYLSTIRISMGAETLLEGIYLLEPGHWMRLAATGAKTIHRYWQPTCPAEPDKPRRSLEEVITELRPLVDDAVQKRLISDVPLGGFLSGGLDSTIIAALANEFSGNQYHAYSVGYAQQGYNEWPYIQAATEAYKMRCQNIELEPGDYTADWEFLVRTNGWPLSTPNEVPIYRLSKALKEEYTVALSGEGADEVFGGYTIAYFAANDFARAARQSPGVDNRSPDDEAILRGYGQDFLPDLVTQHFLLNSWLTSTEKVAWLNPDLALTSNHERAVRTYYHQLYNSHAGASVMDRIMLAHLRVNLEGLLLRVDSSSMAASVEARVPFTDHRLVEFAFTLTDNQRLRWKSAEAQSRSAAKNVMEIVAADELESKVALRRAYQDRVPSVINQRPKMSFPVPVFDWMNNGLQPRIKEIVASSPLRSHLFRPAVVDGWLSGQIPVHPVKLWPLVNLCLWHDTVGEC